MGIIEERDGTGTYQQEDGEVTARFAKIEEKMVLSHEDSPGYRRAFNLLVIAGLLYLAYIFLRT